jgi:hypothetical protein
MFTLVVEKDCQFFRAHRCQAREVGIAEILCHGPRADAGFDQGAERQPVGGLISGVGGVVVELIEYVGQDLADLYWRYRWCPSAGRWRAPTASSWCAVQFIAREGINQFIDLGTGLPTKPNVHEVAREIPPDARVLYVDNDRCKSVVHTRAGPCRAAAQPAASCGT